MGLIIKLVSIFYDKADIQPSTDHGGGKRRAGISAVFLTPWAMFHDGATISAFNFCGDREDTPCAFSVTSASAF